MLTHHEIPSLNDTQKYLWELKPFSIYRLVFRKYPCQQPATTYYLESKDLGGLLRFSSQSRYSSRRLPTLGRSCLRSQYLCVKRRCLLCWITYQQYHYQRILSPLRLLIPPSQETAVYCPTCCCICQG